MKSGTILLALSFLASKILGLIRDNLLASNFGATNASNGIFNLDAYYAAFRLPDMLFNLLSYGILSAAFVPIFVEILKKENLQSAFKFTNEALQTIGLAIIGLSVILGLFAPLLLRIFVPGFSQADFHVTVNLTRLMLITPILFTIGSIASGIQNSLHKYWGMALAPVFYNLGILGGILFLSKDLGVYGVAIGVAVGAFLNTVVQLPSIFKSGFRYRVLRHWWTNKVKEMVLLSLPRIFGMSVTQVSLIVDTIIASTLSAGSITIINFASNLESLPIGLIGISVAIVSFSTLAAYAAETKTSEFVKEVSDNIRRILCLLIPLACGMFMLRFQIVRLFLGRGKFNWTDTILTANTLGVLLTGLIFGGVVFILARAFYALKDTKTPVYIGVVSCVFNIISSLIFTKIFDFGTYGLAGSNALANLINASLLIIFLSKKLDTLIVDIKEIGKFILSAIIMVVFVQITKMGFGGIFEDINTYFELIAQTFFATFVGIIVYFGSCYLMRCKNMV